MGKISTIGWTGGTWNPWRGCHKITSGCKNCYMFRDAPRFGNDPDVVVRAAKSTFNSPLKWKDPMMVFTCSWSDWFIEEADEWRDEAWDIIRRTPHITYQILTKRPERISDHLPNDWGTGYSNVWIIVSTEDQKNYDSRMSILAEVPAVVKGISAEPLIGPIKLDVEKYPWLQWVVTGGESGAANKIRISEIDWFRNIRDECVSANIPLFHKQHGGNTKVDGAWGGNNLDNKIWEEYPK